MSFIEDLNTEGAEPPEDMDVLLQRGESLESSEELSMDKWPSYTQNDIPEDPASIIKFHKHRLSTSNSEDRCAKYIPMSNSSMFRHNYYNYPSVTDPGIEKALFGPFEEKDYPEDGLELYYKICDEMELAPIGLFYRNIRNPTVDLSYYGFEPNSMRAIAEALKYNFYVKTLSLKGNFLSPDGLYHLGLLLMINSTLVELDLDGCRIRPEGAKCLFDGLNGNRSLYTLNLNRNQLEDRGGVSFANAILGGMGIREVHLKYNNLGSKTASAVADAMEFQNTFTYLDLSWNNFFTPAPICKLLDVLASNEHLQYLNLSWNSLSGTKIASALKQVMRCPELTHLDLNHNMLAGEAIDIIMGSMKFAHKLVTLDLSFNPLTPEDALKIIYEMRYKSVKCKNLNLDNVTVDKEFMTILDTIKAEKSDVTITVGGVLSDFVAKGMDPRYLTLKRAHFLGQSNKRPIDIPLILLLIASERETKTITVSELSARLKQLSATMLDKDLIEEFADSFPGPHTKTEKSVNIPAVIEYIRRLWPESQLTESFVNSLSTSKSKKKRLSKKKRPKNTK